MNRRYLVCAFVMLAAVACEETLVVTNDNNPDRTRVFSNAADLQVFTAGLFAVMHQGTLGGSNDGLQTQMYVMSLENNSGLANFAMGPRGSIPRSQITNARGSQGDGSNTHDWFRNHRAAREAALAYAAIGTLSLGSPALDAQGRAFARLVQGISLGNLSLAYDSASIITENDNPQADAGVIVPLSGYLAVNAAALGYLDSAIAIANANPGAFPIPVRPNLWINGVAISQALFVQIARSYQAYIRANVARTPAERATRNWAQVIADANAGLTANLVPNMDPTNGWDMSWHAQLYASAAWHQMSPFWTGMADTSGAFGAWLATAVGSRSSFSVATPDRRFPGRCGVGSITRPTATPTLALVTTSVAHALSTGATVTVTGATQPEYNVTATITVASTTTFTYPVAGTPATPATGTITHTVSAPTRPSLQACGPVNAGQSFTLMPYLRNRPTGNDIINTPMQTSQYDHWRSRQLQQASRLGPYPIFTAAVLDLLEAEGQMRINGAAGYTAAAALISASRTAAGLPTLVGVGIVDTLALIPGANACVPRVPDATASYTATKCGNIWDAMKHEYRMEALYIHYGAWFFAMRGWGDLPQGTAIEWPVPNQEMDARQQPFYGKGGVGAPGGAAAGNYGLFTGGVY